MIRYHYLPHPAGHPRPNTHTHLWHLQEGKVFGDILISLMPGIIGIGPACSLTKVVLQETLQHLTPSLLIVGCMLDLREQTGMPHLSSLFGCNTVNQIASFKE